jgi:MerR family copper efflux transcriptional regulator
MVMAGDPQMASEVSEIMTMHIGELAERSNMSLRTIRHYDDVGLLKPSGRSDGGFRLYTHEDLVRLLLIRRMKPLGFTLGEMAELLQIITSLQKGDPGSDNPRVRSELEAFIQSIRVKRSKLKDYLVRSDELVELLRNL